MQTIAALLDCTSSNVLTRLCKSSAYFDPEELSYA